VRSWKSNAFLLLCFAWYGYRCFWLQMPDRGPSDFQFYYEAGRHVWHGESPYLEGGYVYSPLLALLLAPLASFGYFTARWIWFAASHAAFLAAGFLLWRRLGRGSAAACSIALVWATAGAAEDGFGLGQVDAVLLLLSVIAIAAKGLARQVSVAAGFALKFLPGILVVLDRRWRATVLLAAVLIAAPWAAVRFGLRGPAGPANTGYLAGTPCVLSWGLPSLAVRFADWPGPSGKLPEDWTFGYDLPKLRLSHMEEGLSVGVAAAVVLLGLAFLPLRDDPAAGAALLALAVAASPISWWHYPVLEYPAIAILLTVAVRNGQPGLGAGTLVAGACTYLLPVTALRHLFHRHERWPDSPWTLQFWTALPAAGGLILFFLLLRLLRDRRRGHVEW
jgi:hypothetical protein